MGIDYSWFSFDGMIEKFMLSIRRLIQAVSISDSSYPFGCFPIFKLSLSLAIVSEWTYDSVIAS